MAVRKLEKLDTSLSRLKRVSDLFVEGKEVVLQDDPVIMVWVNKLNSFEDDEARKDGLAFRSVQLLRIEKEGDENADISSLMAEFEAAEHDERADLLGQLFSQEDLISAMDEVDSTEKWQERGAIVRRGELLTDESASVEDRKIAVEESRSYFAEVQEELERRTKERGVEFSRLKPDALRKAFVKRAAETVTIATFMKERDITTIFYALRNCDSTTPGSHGKCSHERLLMDREQVSQLPDGLLSKVKEAIDSLDISPRDAGNLDAPTLSSESSERPSEEEDSPVSTPMVTSLASLPAR